MREIKQRGESMGIEFELKFRATPEKLEQIRSRIPGDEQVFSMETTYFDTQSRDLSRRHLTLRCRKENEQSVCTLKTPEGELGRGEYAVPCSDIHAAIPELCKLCGMPELLELTADGVVSVCGARFTRIAKEIALGDCTVELALDQGVLSGGVREVPLCEVEAELKDGSREGARAYAMALAMTFGLEPEKYSKFRRALALAEGV
jgi:inorganic triphosphatase YgiF